MADPFGEFTFPIQTFRFTHFVCTFFYFIQIVLYFCHSSGCIRCNSVTKLFETELHVVEVGNRFAQCFRNIGQHSLEITECFSGII